MGICNAELYTGGYDLTLEERFWSKVDIRGEDECWEWKAGRNRGGYGMFQHKLANRVAWELTKGPILEGLCALHSCDNPPCCNPKHLFLDTRTENIADMDRKGRRGSTSGIKNPNVKLTPELVLQIRKEYVPRINSQTKLAKKYGLHPSYVGKIVRNEFWKGLE